MNSKKTQFVSQAVRTIAVITFSMLVIMPASAKYPNSIDDKLDEQFPLPPAGAAGSIL
jgi:hypothetical protein